MQPEPQCPLASRADAPVVMVFSDARVEAKARCFHPQKCNKRVSAQLTQNTTCVVSGFLLLLLLINQSFV